MKKQRGPGMYGLENVGTPHMTTHTRHPPLQHHITVLSVVGRRALGRSIPSWLENITSSIRKMSDGQALPRSGQVAAPEIKKPAFKKRVRAGGAKGATAMQQYRQHGGVVQLGVQGVLVYVCTAGDIV